MKVSILLVCVVMFSVSPALAADIITCDFSQSLQSPWLRLVGDAKVEGGVLATAAQAGWQRSGLDIGPLPLQGAKWRIEYDVKPVTFGDQCQEFVSESPSTHWYMCYMNPQGRLNLHTKAPDGWQRRGGSTAGTEVGKWYHVTVTLTATSIRYAIAGKDGAAIWDSGATKMDDLGAETVLGLVDEASQAGGKSEWDNLRIATDDPKVAAEMKQIAARLEAERKEQERREAAARKLRERGIALIPMPQEVELLQGKGVKLEDFGTILGGSRQVNTAFVGVLRERLGIQCSGLSSHASVSLGDLPASSPLRKRGKQAYWVRSDGSSIMVQAAAPEGFYYAAQTIAQLAARDHTVPPVRISDWPAIENRLVMVAVSQGGFQVIDVDYWKRMIRELAAVKINTIMPYFEGGTMYYEKYPFLGLKGRNGFTIEKGRILSEYAKQHCIEIVPQQESLGHSGNLLCHEELKDIRESGDVFCSSNPKTFEFLGDLYDELCQAFPDAKWIHVGGDEFAGGFAKCPKCAERAKQIGKPGLYAEHLNKLRDMLKARKRGIMIWWHEEGYTDEAAAKLPKDIVVFDWHYGNQASYPTLKKLQDEGFAQTWATPAVTRYYSDPNDWDSTFGNISGFMRAAADRKVPGECTCTWVHGIWGGRNIPELNLYGVVYSGACAWNPYASDYAGFRADFGREWFGVTSPPGPLSTSGEGEKATAPAADSVGRGLVPRQDVDPVGQLIHDGIHYAFGEQKEQKFWAKHDVAETMLSTPLSATAGEIKKRPEIVAEARQLLALCDRATQALEALRKGATRNQISLDYFQHDVHLHATLARRIIVTKSLLDAWEQAKALKGKARDDLLTDQLGALRNLVGDYRQIETMFDRSVLEAGGGKCGTGGWYPFIAGGGIQFRAPQGRAEVEKEIEYLNRAMTMEDLPEKVWAG